MKDNNNHPYYNRPSLESSYKLAVISGICLVLLILYLIVSEVVYDFDDTLIDEVRDTPAETIYQLETNDQEGVIC